MYSCSLLLLLDVSLSLLLSLLLLPSQDEPLPVQNVISSVQNAPWLNTDGVNDTVMSRCSTGAVVAACVRDPPRPLSCAAQMGLIRRVACLCLWRASDLLSSIDVPLFVEMFTGNLGREKVGPFWQEALFRPFVFQWLPAPLLFIAQTIAVLLLAALGEDSMYEHLGATEAAEKPEAAASVSAEAGGDLFGVRNEVEKALAQLVEIRWRRVPAPLLSGDIEPVSGLISQDRVGSFLTELLVRLYALGGLEAETTASTGTPTAGVTAPGAALNPFGTESCWHTGKAPLHRMLLLLGKDGRRLQRKAMAFSQCCFSRTQLQRQQPQQKEQQLLEVERFIEEGPVHRTVDVGTSEREHQTNQLLVSSSSTAATSTMNLGSEILVVPPRLPAGHPLELVRSLGELFVESAHPYSRMTAAADKPDVPQAMEEQQPEEMRGDRQHAAGQEMMDRLLLVHPEAAGVSVTFGLPPSDLSPWHLLSVEALPLTESRKHLLHRILGAQQTLDSLDATTAAAATPLQDDRHADPRQAAATIAATVTKPQPAVAEVRRTLAAEIENNIKDLCGEEESWAPALELSSAWTAPQWYSADYSLTCGDSAVTKHFAMGHLPAVAAVTVAAAESGSSAESAPLCPRRQHQPQGQQQQQQLVSCSAGCCKGFPVAPGAVLRRLDSSEQQERVQQLFLLSQQQVEPSEESEEPQRSSSSVSSVGSSPSSGSMSLLDRATAQLLRMLRGSKPSSNGSPAADEDQPSCPVQLPQRACHGSVGDARRRSCVAAAAADTAAASAAAAAAAGATATLAASGSNGTRSTSSTVSSPATDAKTEDVIHLLSGVLMPRDAFALDGIWAVDLRVTWQEDAATGWPLDGATGKALSLREASTAHHRSSNGKSRDTSNTAKTDRVNALAVCGPEVGLVPVVYGFPSTDRSSINRGSSNNSTGSAPQSLKRTGQLESCPLIPPPADRFFMVSCKTELVRDIQQSVVLQQQMKCELLPVRDRHTRPEDETGDEDDSPLMEDLGAVERLLLRAYSAADIVPLGCAPWPEEDRMHHLTVQPILPSVHLGETFARHQVLRLQDLGYSCGQQQEQLEGEMQTQKRDLSQAVASLLERMGNSSSMRTPVSDETAAVPATAMETSRHALRRAGASLSQCRNSASGSLCWHRFVPSGMLELPEESKKLAGSSGESKRSSVDTSILGDVQMLFAQPSAEQQQGSYTLSGLSGVDGDATGEGRVPKETAKCCSALLSLHVEVSLSQRRLINLRQAHSDFAAARQQVRNLLPDAFFV